MTNLLMINELIAKINLFNEICFLDTSADNEEKKWKDYLDPISSRFFNCTYDNFIANNPLIFPNTFGVFEKYYNFFKLVIEDFESLTLLEIPNQIYFAANDVIKTFKQFLEINEFKVEKTKKTDKGYIQTYYCIYPII